MMFPAEMSGTFCLETPLFRPYNTLEPFLLPSPTKYLPPMKNRSKLIFQPNTTIIGGKGLSGTAEWCIIKAVQRGLVFWDWLPRLMIGDCMLIL